MTRVWRRGGRGREEMEYGGRGIVELDTWRWIMSKHLGMTRVGLVCWFGLVWTALPVGASEAPDGGPRPTAPPEPSIGRDATRGWIAPPALEDIEELCSLLTGCANVAFPKPADDLAGCVSALWPMLASPDALRVSLGIRDCALRANSCSELRDCALAGASPAVCSGRAMTSAKPVGFCDIDGRAVSCWRGYPLFVRDCPRAGEQCRVVSGEPFCALGDCPESMSDGDTGCSASGHRVLSCVNGTLRSRDCGVMGLHCGKGTDGAPTCVPPTPACTGSDHRCEGATAVACLDGHEVRVRCDAAKLVCAPPGAAAQSVGPCTSGPGSADACPESFRPRCVGNTIQYCLLGTARRFACTSFGFDRCSSTASGPRCAR